MSVSGIGAVAICEYQRSSSTGCNGAESGQFAEAPLRITDQIVALRPNLVPVVFLHEAQRVGHGQEAAHVARAHALDVSA